MDERPARQAARDQTDNYYKIPAKELSANGSVLSKRPKRKPNGYGSQSEATKAELIEVQQKLAEKE
jgi:hypothetical protein